MYFFNSPTSNIPTQPQPTSVAMSRSDSRDSTTSTTSTTSMHTSSPAWDMRPHSSSSMSSALSISSGHRRGSSSSCGWLPSPFRSCLQNAALAEEASSYLSDDELLFLSDADHEEAVGDAPEKKELSTEEQIELLKQQQQREEQSHGQRTEAWWLQQEKKARIVRFAADEGKKVRRPSALKRRTTAVRKNLSSMAV